MLETSVRSEVRRSPRVNRLVVLSAVLAIALVAGILVGLRVWSSADAGTFPQSSAIEQQYGVRFSRVAVVGDGGLITLTYVVLDSEKATRFQSDVGHPPELRSEARDGGTKRVSVMKQGHTLRAGQTYYLVYQNTKGALRHGEQTSIHVGDLVLAHAPVL
ncbi:hypothetical protein EV651_12356 [Kribbella sp. VKM Ac-2571]|uniref:hypothetical protein n=1 Tax=Kribbella sp. VKM Ac-2571 TaxID=2512222 RepID=UPI00105DCA81|nr:hypothetical protein [Kribbella sp. VKM Ac-2571]TDO48290.1 hypothetical protein EV651_12356 [Kribbella sp. VKM Ac-2571]